MDDIQSLSGARIPNGYGIAIVEDLLSKNIDLVSSLDIDGISKGKPSKRTLER